MRDSDRLHQEIKAASSRWQRRHNNRREVDVSRNLSDLTEEMQALAEAHQAACHHENIELLIYCTVRTNAEQDSLYAIGRTVKGAIVTNAKAGQSAHNPDAAGKSRAYDCVPLRFGKPVWGYSTIEDEALWNKVGSLGESVGLAWAGRWVGKLHEECHFEIPTFGVK